MTYSQLSMPRPAPVRGFPLKTAGDRKRICIVLGIRPDIIRASLILNTLRSERNIDLRFIWSGQHYSRNLKDIFLRQLNVERPDIELSARGESDAQIVSQLVRQLYSVLGRLRPKAVIFLGDTNTVMGSLAAAHLNIPIVHIEGCMRSYDWRMPEEKYRIISDHLSDVIYAYLEEYKQQGVAEGLRAENIVVTGNPIVDVLDKCYFKRMEHYRKLSRDRFFGGRKIAKGDYYLMTCHRRENVTDAESLSNILTLAAAANRPVYFPASYRTQKVIKTTSTKLPRNILMVDPVGYEEFLTLMSNALGVLSDSGTVVEEACILKVPSVQMRKSTERPQVYDVGACVKFDPTIPHKYPADNIFAKLETLRRSGWANPFGDGKASERISKDIIERIEGNDFDGHKPLQYGINSKRSFREDGLEKLLQSANHG